MSDQRLTTQEREIAREMMVEIQKGFSQMAEACKELKFDPFQDVIDFHKKFGIGYDGPPRKLPLGIRGFRKTRLLDELQEFEEAWLKCDEAEEFDAIIDLIYIALGSAHLHGWDFREGWRRVHDANMAKIRADETNKARYVGIHDDGKAADIVKPPGWTDPDLHDLVFEETNIHQQNDPK